MSHIDREQKIARARELFLGGNNCSQAVFTAFAPEMGIDEKAALRLSGGFGGGMGGMRGVCGTVSGMFLALGALRGFDDAGDLEGKKRLYAVEQALAERFTEAFGTTICKDLLEQNGVYASNMPSERTPEYYRKRPCARYVEWAAGALADALNGME